VDGFIVNGVGTAARQSNCQKRQNRPHHPLLLPH
jgi:hypothetical protein